VTVRRGFALALLALAPVASIAGAAGARRVHRVHVPPPPLSAGLTVDEYEFYLKPSRFEVAPGAVRFRVYNRGMDDHDLTLVDAHGQVHSVPLVSGEDAVLEADLGAGPVRLFCSLFAGTPDSHVDKGMVFDLTAR
jgi:hypothetical protein